MKKIGILLGIVLLLLVAVIAAARLGLLVSDPVAAMAEFGGPPSQFVELDGTRVHFRDEGQGPVLVLLHGSRASLHQWDGWVQELGNRFRIIRVDQLAHGLTGADAHDDYSAARSTFLLHTLLQHLKVERFVLGGTSSGATEAVRYAVSYPDQVEKLLLSTVPLKLPPQINNSAFDKFVFWTHDKLLGTPATTLFWSRFLRSIYGDPNKVTDALVHRYWTLNSLPGQEQRFRARIATWRRGGGPEPDYALAARITVPTLIQWGGAGPVLPRELFCTIAAAFKSTTVRVIQYPELGHPLIMEDPQRTARDALAFVDGAEIGNACSGT